jgi:ribosomal protein S12 methylthiotransferase
LIANTCGFIESAREESLSVLEELASQKDDGQQLVAVGCFPQLVGDRLLQSVPKLDAVLGTRRWMEIEELVGSLEERGNEEPPVRLNDPARPDASCDRGLVLRGTPLATAYLCIADGCSASCAFCSIPRIKGPLQSRPRDDVLDEAEYLVANGARELVVIAQDTTAYGLDRGEREGNWSSSLRTPLRMVSTVAKGTVWRICSKPSCKWGLNCTGCASCTRIPNTSLPD